jgi:hypothetical protein
VDNPCGKLHFFAMTAPKHDIYRQKYAKKCDLHLWITQIDLNFHHKGYKKHHEINPGKQKHNSKIRSARRGISVSHTATSALFPLPQNSDARGKNPHQLG